MLKRTLLATALAAGLDDDGSEPEARTLDQKRADVFTDLILDAPTSSTTSPSGIRGASTEVSIVIQAATLLRADDQSAELKGCGPIPAGKRADAKWADHSTCPQRAADLERLGLKPTDDPPAFWSGLSRFRHRRAACRG